MEKSKVYFTKEITPENVVKMYETLGVNLPGKVAVNLHSGEQGNQNYIRPEFVRAIVEKVNGTVVVDGEVLGNTQYVANLIAEQTGGDIFRIEPVDAYPTDHDELLDRAREEMSRDARPEISNAPESIDEYDVVFIGYPIWNADLPPIINTFLEQYNFDGKTVIPFCTHGGSGLAGTQNTIANKLTNSTVITNAFSLSRTRMEAAPAEVESWLREINVIS